MVHDGVTSVFGLTCVKLRRLSLPLNIQDCVGLIIDNVDEHVGLSVIHPAFLVHMKLMTKKVRYLRKAQKTYKYIHLYIACNMWLT